jgi:hypothetical protein
MPLNVSAARNVRRMPGELVVYHEIWHGDVWAARPMIVAQDEDDLVVLWFPKGTGWKRPIPHPAHPPRTDRSERLAQCLVLREWIFEDAEWEVATLVLVRPGDWHAIWVSWLDDGTQWGWYVNLQEPVRRTPIGFATMDLALDVLVGNDRSWRWKDEDELDTFVVMGVIDVAVAERIREEGLRVARRAERNEPPFSEPWPEWKPDPSWPLPVLSEGWDECP